jgi:phosphatidylglycerol lysyltransferase
MSRRVSPDDDSAARSERDTPAATSGRDDATRGAEDGDGALDPDRTRYLALLRAHGTHAVSFQGLESEMRYFFDGRGAVAYVETGGAWIAGGAPVAPRAEIPGVAEAFVAAAAARKRRACFFGVEGGVLGDGFRTEVMGEQPILDVASWRAAKATHKKLREQVRRARAKGVVARFVEARELAPGTPLRREVARLEALWLATRPMPPMGFLVSVEPFILPGEHRYLVAERDGRAVMFMSLVPIYARGAWLVEDILRDPAAPNGTAELVFDRLLESASPDETFTHGLAPLTGAVSPWLALVRDATSALYNFGGLRAFKARLHPARWEPVTLAVPRRGSMLLAIFDSLTAFARGAFVGFGLRSIARNPGGVAWVLGVPLLAWTALLALFVALDAGSWMGWARMPLFGWTVFDLLLAVLMLRVARAPRRSSMLVLAAFALADAVLSALHLRNAGIGQGAVEVGLRLLSFLAPVLGATALALAAKRTRAH